MAFEIQPQVSVAHFKTCWSEVIHCSRNYHKSIANLEAGNWATLWSSELSKHSGKPAFLLKRPALHKSARGKCHLMGAWLWGICRSHAWLTWWKLCLQRSRKLVVSVGYKVLSQCLPPECINLIILVVFMAKEWLVRLLTVHVTSPSH